MNEIREPLTPDALAAPITRNQRRMIEQHVKVGGGISRKMAQQLLAEIDRLLAELDRRSGAPVDAERLARAMRGVLDTTTRERVLPYVDKIAAEYDRLAASPQDPPQSGEGGK